jgi:hypothetical protein
MRFNDWSRRQGVVAIAGETRTASKARVTSDVVSPPSTAARIGSASTNALQLCPGLDRSHEFQRLPDFRKVRRRREIF